ARVLHHRLHRLPEDRLGRVEAQFARLASARAWRGDEPWIATDRAHGLFEMEYLRHVREAEGEEVSAAGFLKVGGDETDVLVLMLFLRDLSAEYGIRSSLRDEDNPLAKLRHLEFRRGRLPSGNSLEEMLARRAVIKKVGGQRRPRAGRTLGALRTAGEGAQPPGLFLLRRRPPGLGAERRAARSRQPLATVGRRLRGLLGTGRERGLGPGDGGAGPLLRR